MESVERLVRDNAFELSAMFSFEVGGTVCGRVNRLTSSDGMVGYALDALRQGYFGEESDRRILLEYQALTRAPRETCGKSIPYWANPGSSTISGTSNMRPTTLNSWMVASFHNRSVTRSFSACSQARRWATGRWLASAQCSSFARTERVARPWCGPRRLRAGCKDLGANQFAWPKARWRPPHNQA
jgi:hypothetical protein